MAAAPSPEQVAALLAEVRFDARGLVPAVAQRHDDGEVLMLAWMDAAAIRETLATGQVCYFSRSRNALWRKGETSGQRQRLVELRLDCDGDTILLKVEQTGVACHTGRRSCLFRAFQHGRLETVLPVEIDPRNLYRADLGALSGGIANSTDGVSCKPAGRLTGSPALKS
ncbi:MAG: phosphoribosyl-AMP cyclohydrolase [Alphaproteobacteria bacterium]|nr:phosphoribosyl-AMP cyclohydrolase [Alphaproteobacteria bacterium]